ncbi:(R)-mandelonitrile lyase 4 [Morus notabilis]|uniref:(R)-mandelonitrile lyase 4 n=1 Tax=Morus notabilis TaxID=981085 RepID=W9S9H3_9ROSA|nr:(R)-mandelonitrile lyase 4 [Morus notabilis]
MADNPRNNINLVIPFPFEASSAQVVGITSDYYIETVSFSLSFFPIPLPFSLYPSSVSTELSLAIIAEKITGPLSHGSLQLASRNDVKVAPHVGFNYFADPVDLSRCVSAVRKMGDLLNTNSMDPFKYKAFNGERGFMFLGPALPSNNSDDSAMEDYCRSTVTNFWHYHGGGLVGKVVDGDFRVMGVNSLRVVDGSTFILSPGTNPQATLMMLGRSGLTLSWQRRLLTTLCMRHKSATGIGSAISTITLKNTKKNQSFFTGGSVAGAAACESPFVAVVVPPLTSKSPLVVVRDSVHSSPFRHRIFERRQCWFFLVEDLGGDLAAASLLAWRQTPAVDLSPCCRPHAASFDKF